MKTRHLPKNVTRRDILRFALAGTGLAALGPMVGRMPVATGAPLTSHKRLVVVFCDGGYDGLSLLPPVTSNAYYARRPSIAIQAVDALNIGDANYMLHPSMPKLAALFNAGEGAAIRKVGYPNANQSHFTSSDVLHQGIRGAFADLNIPESGWLARYAENYARSPIGAVGIGVGQHPVLNGGSSSPFQANDLSSFGLESDGLSGEAVLARTAAVRDVLASFSGTGVPAEAAVSINQAYQLVFQVHDAVANYSSTVADDYPTEAPGQYLKDMARLIQGGLDTSVFFTSFSGFDTHGGQGNLTGRLPNLLKLLDDSLGTFAADLQEMNVWNDTLVLVVSEFGRRNFQNAAGGTDHGHGNTYFAFGGGVNGGLYGPAYTEGELTNQNFLNYSVDYRDVIRAAVLGHMGRNPAPVLPETQVITNALAYV